MISRARHLQEDSLFECYLAEQDGEPIDPPVAEHLADCTECGVRYTDLRRFMDGLRAQADAELDETFPAERFRAQQLQIARRIEHLGHAARVISFPGHPPGHPPASAASHPALRWIVGAAAAGLVIGVGLGSFFHSGGRVAQPAGVETSMVAPRPELAASPSVAAPESEPLADVSDEFLSELELALERPHTRELVALDDLTPHVREIQLR